MNSENWLYKAILSWGKTDGGASQAVGGQAWNSLLAHLLDTAAAAGALWDRYLPPSITSRLTDAFGNGQTHLGRRMVMFLAALHDMGKASDCFQRQFGTGRPASPQTHAEREIWEKAARAGGLPLADDLDAAPWARHEHITAAHLPRLLGCACQDCGGQGNVHQGLHTVAHLLGGHHGNIPQKDTVDRAAGAAPLNRWEPIYRALIEEIARLTGVNLEEIPALVNPQRPSAMPLFAGLVVLADWIASDEGQFPYRTLTDTTEQWWALSHRDADAALTRLKLDRWQPTGATWPQLWPGTNPRDFQAAAMRILPQHGPALVIVESDTGSGKTRLALWCAHHFARTCGSPASTWRCPPAPPPTRSPKNSTPSSNTHRWSSPSSPSSTAPPPPPTSSTASWTPPTPQAATWTTSPRTSPTTPPAATPPTTTPASRPGPRYLRRCLGLIAGFGIGTIDQLVLAAQKSRHWYLRMLGLAAKTVIIDEAHAYELYQQDLLSTAINWLADAGASVVVLSATLPATARHALSTAWCHGHGTPLHDSATDGPITVIDQHGHTRRTGPTTPPPPLHTHIDFQPATDPTDLAQQLLHEGRHGGCIGVVRTRVASATQLYTEAVAHAPDAGWDSRDIVLLHGRLMPRHRLPLENTLTALLGTGPDRNHPNPRRPHRLLVIATQVIEQSLDLDFDRLYSDLAPIDLLIQRRGRFHRHRLNNPARPEPFTHPRLTVWWKPDSDGLPKLNPLTTATAAPRQPRRVRLRPLHPRRHLAHPHQPGRHQRQHPHHHTERQHAPHRSRLRPHHHRPRTRRRTPQPHPPHLAEHPHRRTPPSRRTQRPPLQHHTPQNPAAIHDLAAGQAHGDGDHKGIKGIAALSRLGDPPINAIALYRQPDHTLTYDPEAHPPRRSTHTAQSTPQRTAQHRAQQRNLLLNTLTLPHSWFTARNPHSHRNLASPAPPTPTTPSRHPPRPRRHLRQRPRRTHHLPPHHRSHTSVTSPHPHRRKWTRDAHRFALAPHPRGCSPQPGRPGRAQVLLPAPAGMVPCRPRAGGAVPLLPAPAGMVPPCPAPGAAGRLSPHPRGWSRVRRLQQLRHHLLPAPAGMVPTSSRPPRAVAPVPRTRGDGPLQSAACFGVDDCSPHPRG